MNQMSYSPDTSRYDSMIYNRCGKSGLKLPALSLGLWHNFGLSDDYENCRRIVHTAFDNGITHFDLANNYGPPAGGAETVFGRILKQDLLAHRDEIIVSSKAGYGMWPGPYGDWGSKKYLVASLDQSLKRMGLDYVDIFYHHRPDPNTPLEETMGTLDAIVRQGKALYAGISSYSPSETAAASDMLRSFGTPLLIHQPKYSMLERTVEKGLLDVLEQKGIGCISFSSLAQGILTNKYLNGIPAGSRAASNRGNGALEAGSLDVSTLDKVKRLNELAARRGQSLAQMALAWALRDHRINSVIIGASKPGQVKDSVLCLKSNSFAAGELNLIDQILQ
ncbi:MAG TPA: aldo/keto reductase [Flavisolibacter sp.]|nr:aldo/keto reductase [Flavisolibacter sp.]